jgi:AcrR family transcriptional regulator
MDYHLTTGSFFPNNFPIMEKIKKKDITQKRILAAARTIFSQKSYNAASIRMIANEGGFDFGLIRYHFPNKAELFKAVLKQSCDELYDVHKKAMMGIREMRTEDGLSLYFDRLLKHNFKHPETLRILMNNIYRPTKPGFEIPGYDYLPQVLSSTRDLFEKNINLIAPKDEIDRFVDSCNAQVLMFVAGSSCQAKMLGLKPESKEYRQWVKDTLMYIFLPHLKRLLFH